MTVSEFQIKLDLNKENEADLLKEHASLTDFGYFFVDSEDGQCYLFDMNGKMDDVKKITTINNGYVKKDIQKITIPNGVTDISYGTFSGCKNLKSVTIPASVKYIGTRAFDYCLNLKELRLPAKTKVIDFRAFNDCPKFQTLYLDSIIPPLLEGYKPHWRFAGESKNLVVKVPAGSLNAYKSADGWKDLKIEEV